MAGKADVTDPERGRKSGPTTATAPTGLLLVARLAIPSGASGSFAKLGRTIVGRLVARFSSRSEERRPTRAVVTLIGVAAGLLFVGVDVFRYLTPLVGMTLAVGLVRQAVAGRPIAARVPVALRAAATPGGSGRSRKAR